MVRRSCSQTTSVICFSAHKQWPNCSIVHAYQNQPESTKILIVYLCMIKEDFIIKSSFHHEHKCYHKNKACCILMGIKNFANKFDILLLSMYAWIKLTEKQRNSKFSWELEQRNSILMGIRTKMLNVTFSRCFKHMIVKNNRFYTRDLMET